MFIATFFLSIILFVVTMMFFQWYGPVIFVSLLTAGLVSMIMNQDARIKKLEEELGVREKTGTDGTDLVRQAAIENPEHTESDT